MSDCGVTYEHAPHLFTTQRGKVKACDGAITKVRHASRKRGQ